jgi:hypothetical protein
MISLAGKRQEVLFTRLGCPAGRAEAPSSALCAKVAGRTGTSDLGYHGAALPMHRSAWVAVIGAGAPIVSGSDVPAPVRSPDLEVRSLLKVSCMVELAGWTRSPQSSRVACRVVATRFERDGEARANPPGYDACRDIDNSLR